MLLADGRTGILALKNNTQLIFSHVSIPTKLIIDTGATSIKWNYTLNMNVQATYGGEVGQILSAFVDAITLTGQTRDNNQQKEIYEWFLRYMQLAGLHSREQQAVKFEYPERGWVFYIQPTISGPLEYDRDKIALPWTVTAEVVADNDANYLSGYTMSVMGEAVTFDPTLYDVGFNVEQPSFDPSFGATLAENFESLLGAWATGDFHHWGFDALAPPKKNALNPDAQAIFNQAFGTDYVAGKPATGSTSGSAALGGPGGIGSTFSCSALNSNQNTYANLVVKGTGLSPAVVCAWCFAEINGSAVAANIPHHNWLNVSGGPFPTDSAGAHVAISTVNTGQLMNDLTQYQHVGAYNGPTIRQSAGQPSDRVQLSAIWHSPWASGHYNSGGGPGSELEAAYNAVKNRITTIVTTSVGNDALRSSVAKYAWVGLNAKQIYLAGVSDRPMSQYTKPYFPRTDCSGFVELCYRYGTDGNAKYDPMGPSNHYSGASSFQMATSSNGKTIPLSDIRQGDIAIYPDHVVIIVDPTPNGLNTTVISNGGPGAAHALPLGSENAAFSSVQYRSFLS